MARRGHGISVFTSGASDGAGHGEGKDPLAEVSEMNHTPVSQGLLPLTVHLGLLLFQMGHQLLGLLS